MPRRGENIYKRKDGRWEGRIQKPDGKYQYVYAKTYKEIKEKKKNYQDYMKQPKIGLPDKTACASGLFESWLKGDLSNLVKPSTYENYYCCIQKYVLPFFEGLENDSLTESTAAQFVKSVKENDALSDSYKRKILAIFKTALREILKDSASFSLIMEAVKLPKIKNSSVQVFSISEQRLIETEVLRSDDQKVLGILLCFYTGIRLGELCALRWSDFDFEAGTMSIIRTVSRTKNFQQNGNKTTLLIGTPKSPKSIRKIPLPKFIPKSLKRLEAFSSNESDFVLSGTNIPLDPRTYQKLFKKILRNVEVKDRKFHAIRHTFATRALELGIDIKTLSELLGHSNVSITLNIYAHSLMEQKKIAMDKFNQLHNTQMEGDPFSVDNPVTCP